MVHNCAAELDPRNYTKQVTPHAFSEEANILHYSEVFMWNYFGLKEF
jgi:hypothetical protein